MTDTQLYLSIGVPTFAILIGILVNLIQVNGINARITSLETSTNARFNSMEATMNARMTSLESRMHSLEARFDTLLEKLVEMDSRLIRLERG